MRENGCIIAALLAAVMTTACCRRCSTGCGLNNLYIQDFLNTSEPIWVFNSTTTTKLTCKVDVVSSFVGTTVTFRRLYIQNLRTVRESLVGHLNTSQQDRIYITKEGRNCEEEQLMYMSYDRKCGVVMVTASSDRNPYYELRIRNSSISAPFDYECVAKFHSYHQPCQQLYTRDCQRILQPGCRIRPCYIS